MDNLKIDKTLKTDPIVYEKRTTIGYSTIGKQGRLKIVSIMNFLQDAASEHANLMGISGFHLAQADLAWVIFRYHIEIKSDPEWNEKILIRTDRFSCKNLYEIRNLTILKDEPESFIKREDNPQDLNNDHAIHHTKRNESQLRDFHINRQENEIVNAKVCWVMVNKKNGKPVRLSKFMDNDIIERSPFSKDSSSDKISSKQDNYCIESYFQEVIKPETIHYQLPFKVRMHDLDLNGHVNNAIFVEWGVETVPERILSKFSPASIDVIFNKESLYGDVIVSHTEIREDSEKLLTFHSIIRQQDQAELSRLNIVWRSLHKK